MGQQPSSHHRLSMVPRVLSIPEIASLTFRFSDTPTRRNAALVCKAWLEPALDELWRSITVLDVCRLLAPMHRLAGDDDACRPHIWIFSSFISPSAWSRFDFYAYRIREMSIEGISHYIIDPTVFTEISRARPRLAILPRLQSLTSRTSLLIHTTLFMHPGLKSLSVKLDGPFAAGEGFKEIKAYLVDMSVRLVNLTKLELVASFSVARVKSELIQMLRSLYHLEELTLPRYWITDFVLAAVDKLPALKVIQWRYSINGEQGDVEDILQLNYIPSDDDAFPALLDFNLEANIPSPVMDILRAPFASRLSIIYIRSIDRVSPSQVHDFLLHCGAECPSLTQLHLELMPDIPPTEGFPEQITIETLSPILAFKHLTRFSMQYFYPISLTDDDIARIACNCPSLVSLKLAKDPYLPGNTNLTLEALLPLAEHCHRLEELALYLDTSAIPLVSDLAPSFKRLHTLDFGASDIDPDKIDRIALFLSHICANDTIADPDLCKVNVDAELLWDREYSDAMDRFECASYVLEERRRYWQAVGERMSVLLALRVEERMRTRHLQAELERLRSMKEQKPWVPAVVSLPSWTSSPFSRRRRRISDSV